MKLKYKPFYVFEVNGNMKRCDKNGEIELKGEAEIKKAKSLGFHEVKEKEKREVKKNANMQ